jgi:hypothetical protein
MSDHNNDTHGNPDVRFEESDVATKPVAYSVLALAIFTVVFTYAGHLTFQVLAERQMAETGAASPLAAQHAVKQPPEPRLQLEPKTDLEILHAAEDQVLGKWAWVNKEGGIVQVPVDRAMKMLLAKGLPSRQGPVPLAMAPRGVAPRQPAEAEGAPDWYDADPKSPSEHGAHGAATHETKHPAPGHGSEPHGH